MTNNPTIDGVSRWLIEQSATFLEAHGSGPSIESNLAADLRALLDAPAVERQSDRREDAAHVHGLKRDALQSTIAQLEDKLNKAIDLDFQRRETITGLEARIAELESGKGEPVEALLLSDCVEMANREYGGGYFGTDVVQLYTAPPAPVAVALPTIEQFKDAFRATGYVTHDQAWELAEAAEACLDATAALNEEKR